MKDSDKIVSRAIIIILLALTTFTYVLLVASNNRPLFAPIILVGIYCIHNALFLNT
jgi:hypothetical protein